MGGHSGIANGAFYAASAQPVFVIATTNVSGPKSAADSLTVRACLSLGANLGPANDVKGDPMNAAGSASTYTTTGAPAEQTVSIVLTFTPPAGTYTALWQYQSSAGVSCNVDTKFGGECDLFLMGG